MLDRVGMYRSEKEGEAVDRLLLEEAFPFRFFFGVDVKGKSKPRRLGV